MSVTVTFKRGNVLCVEGMDSKSIFLYACQSRLLHRKLSRISTFNNSFLIELPRYINTVIIPFVFRVSELL